MKTVIRYFSLAALILIMLPAVCRADVQFRPANFVFLIDVSGSMLSKKTMVTGPNGQPVTLFEALRDALKQIVSDDRLLTPQSKVAFVTFGTAIEEKADWPSNLDKPENRATLTADISSPDKLQADKHGDTYMAGALDKAYEKATQLSSQSEPCTTCFIVMLTDGWDEPPKGATLKVRDEAARIVAKQGELRRKLGVNTWQVRVVGLQRLPDRKAGTTTAAELASLLGGEFLDVTRQSNGTVAQRIYAALQKTISELQGKVEVASVGDGGFADFGVMHGAEGSQAAIPVASRSCYGEQVNAVRDITEKLSDSERHQVQQWFEQWRSAGRLKDAASFANVTFAANLPAGALSVELLKSPFLLTPTIDQVARGGHAWQSMNLVAHVGAKCPPGAYLGALHVDCTARCDALVPYVIAVPSRIVTSAQAVKCTVKKPSGICWTEPTSTELKFAVGTSLAGKNMTAEEVTVEPEDGKAANGAILKAALINDGQPLSLKLQMTKPDNQPISLRVQVPADQQPGTYSGRVHIKLKNSANVIAPAALTYTVEILPSSWEQVRPIAIPIMSLLGMVLFVWLAMWVASMRNA